jgi:molybdopterin molybdotransferase
MAELISVDEALSLVLKNTDVLKPERKRIEDALLCVLAEDVKSPSDSPPFSQSSMDGYAIRFEDLKRNNSLLVQGINQAGTDSS